MNHNYKENFELTFCETCRLFEGALTTDCSGENSTSKSDEIYSGKIDYRKGEGWVNKLNPTNQFWLKGAIFDLMKGKSKYSHENEIILAFGTTKEEYEEIKSQVVQYLYGNTN